MIFFQIKLIRKGTKPPIWRRAYIPSNITFAQMALILEEILEFPKSDRYEFEFYNKKDRVIEWHEEDVNVGDFYYTYLNAPDTFVNDWMMNERWFTFRIRGVHTQMPEYRIEVEKMLADIRFKDGRKEAYLTYPLIVKEMSIKDDEYWTNGNNLNESLKERYFLKEEDAEYSVLSELLHRLEKKQGIGYCTKPVNRDIHTKKSANAFLAEAADLIKGHIGIEIGKQTGQERENSKSVVSSPKASSEQMKKQYKYHATMEGILSSYTKPDLTAIAEAIDIQIKAGRKDQMVHELARALLEPQMMREQLLMAEEEELDALETAVNKGYFKPSEQEWSYLEGIYDLNYLAAYEDGVVAVPDEVKVIYDIIKRNGYRTYHQKARWLVSCLNLFAMIHVVAPIKVLYQMYRKNKNVADTYSEFISLFDTIPNRLNACRRIEDKIVARGAATNEIYKKIEERQRDIDYYIPSMKETKNYAAEGYPVDESAYIDLRNFLSDDMGVDNETSGYLCEEAFRTFSIDGMPSDYMDIMDSEGIVFQSEKHVEKFASIMMNVNNCTRRFILKGHTPNEMHKDTFREGGKFPTIVPMSSMAAELLESGRHQMKEMGIEIDTDSTAAKVSTMRFPNGMEQKVESGVKKVYPNDPCPCGSGKKFKKCCGRNHA